MKRKPFLLLLMIMICLVLDLVSVPAISVAAATPAKPTITLIKKSNDTTLWIRWANAKNAKKYELYCSVSGGAYKKVATTMKLYYKHTGLKAGKTYSYKVRSVNGSNKSKFSAIKKYKISQKKGITVSSSSVSFEGAGLSKVVKVTETGCIATSCASSNTKVADCEWTSDGVGVRITSIGAGTATIFIYDETGLYTKTIAVTVEEDEAADPFEDEDPQDEDSKDNDKTNEDGKPIAYGSVSGNVTWHYNEYRGYIPDNGARVFLIPTDKSAKGYTPNYSIIIDSDSKLLPYNIFRTEVDGNGNYIFDRVPTGTYCVIIISGNSRAAEYFKASDKSDYESSLAKTWTWMLSEDAAKSLAKAVFAYNYYEKEIHVYDGGNTTVSNAFPYTYI